MSTQQLLALDLLLVVLSCALFLAAGCLTLSLRAGSGRSLVVGALVCAVLGRPRDGGSGGGCCRSCATRLVVRR